ncbi:flocculation protein FLO11-like [Xyrichtys novacula]|uniref:Flocculation protein FLO11-like n=1 Tax=Xyrichtys novacula TaxID=13765 RepID=A0AAV1FZ67_XYRNO|nr:flocculation protein FLO11-like [Xyrichtys novacula]
MSSSWREDDEDYRIGGGARGVGLKSKPRFSFHEIKVLLEAVKRNRYILLRKFNQGVSAETKKQTWTEITHQINALGENHREVRQIMKKWADLKCDGKRRLIALRGVNGHPAKKKNMGPVERMVHKILMMSPKGNGESDLDLCADEDFAKIYSDAPPSNPSPYSYLSMTDSSVPDRFSFDMSPLSSPENDASGDPFHSSSEFDLDLGEDGEQSMDYDDNEDSMFSYPSSLPPPSSALQDQELQSENGQLRIKPVHTYSRTISQTNNNDNNTNHVQNNTSSKPPPEPSSVASTSSAPPPVSDSGASSSSVPPSKPTTSSDTTASSSSFVPPLPPPSTAPANDAASQPAPSSSSVPPPPPASSTPASTSSSAASTSASAPSSSNSQRPSPSSSSSSSAPSSNKNPTQSSIDPLPAGASSRRVQDHVAQMAVQSLEQQRASRMLLTSVSQSLEALAQSVQLLVESQQEFVQESLLLQRETVDVLRDFSNTALTMLRDKSNSGQTQTRHHHPASHF